MRFTLLRNGSKKEIVVDSGKTVCYCQACKYSTGEKERSMVLAPAT